MSDPRRTVPLEENLRREAITPGFTKKFSIGQRQSVDDTHTDSTGLDSGVLDHFATPMKNCSSFAVGSFIHVFHLTPPTIRRASDRTLLPYRFETKPVAP
jgi:hypothetical protein